MALTADFLATGFAGAALATTVLAAFLTGLVAMAFDPTPDLEATALAAVALPAVAFTADGFDVAAFAVEVLVRADFAPEVGAPKMDSHPFEYFSFVPTRVMVTSFSLQQQEQLKRAGTKTTW